MKNNNALIVFSVVGVIAYAIAAYAIVAPGALFAYFPAVGEFHFQAGNTMAPPKALGPAMYYYGWTITAALVALIAALIVPRILKARIWPGLTLTVTLLVLVYTAFVERHWFL